MKTVIVSHLIHLCFWIWWNCENIKYNGGGCEVFQCIPGVVLFLRGVGVSFHKETETWTVTTWFNPWEELIRLDPEVAESKTLRNNTQDKRPKQGCGNLNKLSHAETDPFTTLKNVGVILIYMLKCSGLNWALGDQHQVLYLSLQWEEQPWPHIKTWFLHSMKSGKYK